MANYKILHEDLSQYKFYWYEGFLGIVAGISGHNNYIKNTVEVFNKSLDEYKSNWINKSYSESIGIRNEILNRDDFLNEFYPYGVNNYNPSSMLKVFGDDFLSEPNKYKDLIIRLLYFSIYNVDSINFDTYNNFDEVIYPTFSCFDYFSTLSSSQEYIDASTTVEKTTVIENHIYDFFDEISAKIDIKFDSLKIHFEDPFTLVPSVNLSKYKFFYDTTETDNTSFNTIKNLVSVFKSTAVKFEKEITENNIESYKSIYSNRIIDEPEDFSIFLQSDNVSGYISRNKLALRILWHSFINIKEEFVLNTFNRFDCYLEVIGDSSTSEEKLGKIEADLLSNTGLFFHEFKEDIFEYFESLIPITEDEYKIKLSDNISDSLNTFVSKTLSPDYFQEEVDFFKKIVNDYKKAKDEYINIRLTAYGKRSDKSKDIEPSEARNILVNILNKEFLPGDDGISMFGVNPSNEDPNFGSEEYQSLASKYIYYISFAPLLQEEKPRRDYKYSTSFYSNYYSTIVNEDEESFYDENNYKEKFYRVFEILSRAIEIDFKTDYDKVKKDYDNENNILKNSSREKILPYGFNEKFTVHSSINENLNHIKKLFKIWENWIDQYKLEISTNGKSDVSDAMKNSVLKRIESSSTINKGITYSSYLSNIDYYGSIIQKLAFFYIFLIVNKNIIIYPLKNITEGFSRYFYSPRVETEGEIFKDERNSFYYIKIDNTKYNVEGLYIEFKKEAERIISEIESEAIGAYRALESQRFLEQEVEKYEKYLESIKAKLSFEEDFFYIKNILNKKTIPTIPSVDVEFRVYKENNEPEWVSVSRRSLNGRNKIPGTDVFHDNYFEKMSFEDTGGKKQINLSLRTADDINLEKIILNSLMKPVEIFNDYIKNSNLEEEDPENIVKTSNYRIANFRIRFGYSDTPLQDDTAINEKEIASPGFSRRTENTKPVIKSPWLYFLINKLETDFVSLETSFEIGGLNVGSYMLDEFRIYNKIPYDSLTQVTARKAIGILSKILFESSNGTICVLGEEKDSIVFDYDNSSSGELSLKKIKTKGSDNSLGVSYFDFDPFYVEVLQEGKIKGVETKTFEIKEEKDEDGNKNIPTARKLLDSLSDFLPTKLYGVPKLDGGNKIAFEVMKSKESIIKDYAKELKISYDLIECEAEILDKFGNIDKKYGSNKRRTFIRFYYKGPISRDIPSSEKIRFYKYRGIKDSIVKSFRVENPMNFQKIYGVIGSFESYESALFYTSKISSKILSSGGFIGNKKKLNIKDYSGSIFIPKDDIKHEDVPLVDPKVGTNSISLNKISEISNSLSRYVYEGELEIVGDPYFIFDDDLEPWRNMIYLKVNRYENIKNEKLADNDYYSGLYMIKKINHEISSDGDFITRLNIVKFTMAEKEE